MKISFNALRFQMTTTQLVTYANACGIKLSTINGKHKKKIANQIWEELKNRGVV